MPGSEPLILAIDQGTSATKTALVNPAGEVVARAAADLAVHHPRKGWVEQSPDEIWRSIEESVKACLSGTGHDGAHRPRAEHAARVAAALGPSHRRGPVAVDQLAGPAHRGAVPRVRALRRLRSGSSSGLPLDPMFSATKARWLLDQYDPDRARAARGDLCLGTVDAWILHRLTGEHQTEVGNASRTQLMDIRTCQWSPRLLDLFGVPAAALPEIVGSAGPFARRAGGDALPRVPVLAVMGDSHAALFGHAGWRPGLVKATYGTGTSVMAAQGGAGRPPGSARRSPGSTAPNRSGPSRATSGQAARPWPGWPG